MEKAIIKRGSNVRMIAYGIALNAKVIHRNGAYCTIKTEPFYHPTENVYLKNGQTIGGVKVSELTKQ